MSTLERQVAGDRGGDGRGRRRGSESFDPGMDVATVVFSHVQCVKTRVNLAW